MTDSDLAGLLTVWLPAQRWFAGAAAAPRLEITSQVRLGGGGPDDGNPELVHLLADVRAGEMAVSYQVLVGLRGALPPALEPALIGQLADGRYAYDALRDPDLAAVLLRGIADRRSVGPLRFAAEPDAIFDRDAVARTMSAEQSNTSIVFGDQAILKVLRRPFQGRHPDLEVPMALARMGSALVAAPLGWIQSDAGSWQTGGSPGGAGELAAGPDEAGEPIVLAILSRFYAGAADGWSLALADLDRTAPDFSEPAWRLGLATGQLHDELAGAFGWSDLSPAVLAAAMSAELDRALREVPALQDYAPAIRACYAELAGQDMPVPGHRIHGDYHLGQVLGTDQGWIVLDFEGEPSVPLAQRRAPAPALRDVAGMLRSFDYAARHRQLGRADDSQLLAWAKNCETEFCAGYAASGRGDPRQGGPLLRALTYQKAVYEAVYEARHRPAWLPIPLTAIAEAGS